MMTVEESLIEDERELVTFRVGDQDFCIDIIHVREIRGWTPATVLPHAPEYVLGVINLRGAIVPIVDLARRLGLAKTDLGDRHVIVIAVVADQTVGFLVDAVSDIIGVAPQLIQPTPDITAQTTQRFIQGVIALEQRMLRLIDISAVLPPLVKDVSA
ncbi:chemotaxis protein CheW [Loktanella sp. M215]|uniref:chemotaxis protein CheW n=1 Tax=Loktanella sp. M215 TaxID=2675431 RepID=UPI001F19504E|nr:chemotaxis protein CheW [Loktanella sp. M215]MCF7699515.1 chemotaxis protein CheW [Loktanella sp. M215]